ncbi:hypothetical protein ACH5RR_016552 [Cinchona calisaya]|uniref:Uncharacterized protein n=1 Tax=Cinchona calisaya TaxID=153742 RepID=A0ABD2ZXG1_9GENT
MDSSFFVYDPFTQSSREYTRFNSSSGDEQFTSNMYSHYQNYYQPCSLPFNENDPQEMLLAGVISEAVYESLKQMEYGFEEGCSPVLVMKKRHSMNRKNALREKKSKELMNLDDDDNNVLVFEDLGSEYLEELLSVSESSSCPWSS